MNWFRRHIRSGAWLGLTALALHFVLTFGHVHAEGFSPASIAVASSAVESAQADQQAADEALVHDNGGDASDEHFRTLRAHHFCAICATISLLGTSVPPIVSTLALPVAIVSIRKPDFTSAASPHDFHSSFQARAPPAA